MNCNKCDSHREHSGKEMSMIFNSCSDALSLGSARNGTKFATENRRSLSASVLQRSVHKLISIDISIYVIESESLKQLFLPCAPMVCD